jgi:hypothetical protein
MQTHHIYGSILTRNVCEALRVQRAEPFLCFVFPQSYAPVKREGLRIDKDAHKFETTCLEDLKYSELVELENSIPKSMTNVRIERPKMNKFK